MTADHDDDLEHRFAEIMRNPEMKAFAASLARLAANDPHDLRSDDEDWEGEIYEAVGAAIGAVMRNTPDHIGEQQALIAAIRIINNAVTWIAFHRLIGFDDDEDEGDEEWT